MGTNDNKNEYWRDIFPYNSPYENQIAGINTAVDTLKDSGIYLMEGPCGTGKTLIALTAGLSLVRDRKTKFERILVITSKKQQLSAFEDDYKAIEKNGDETYDALTLIGKSELCPYVQAGVIDSDEIYHRCLQLRDNTYELIQKAVEAQRAQSPIQAAYGLELIGREETNASSDNLSFNDIDVPVGEELPEVGNEEFCPFYASQITNKTEKTFPLDFHRVTTGKEILEKGAKNGTCPHLEMKRLHSRASVLFGNYKHVFDPATVGGLTHDVIDDRTILICDEAHGLVSNVRNQLSYSIRYTTIKRAIQEINEVQRWLRGETKPEKYRLSKSIINNTNISLPDLGICVKFLDKIRDLFEAYINESLEKEFRNPKGIINNPDREQINFALQNPETDDPDILTRWAENKGYNDIWKLLLKTTKLISVIKDVIAKKVEGKSPDGSFAVGSIHELLNRWWTGNHSEYYREVVLHPRNYIKENTSKTKKWRSGYTAEIKINNCIPQNEIAATVDIFGGAILMSATLSPLDIYEEVTGMKKLRKGKQPENSLITEAIKESSDHEEQGGDDIPNPNLDSIGDTNTSEGSTNKKKRNIKRSEFDISFPQENRKSIAIDVTKFTYSNREPKSRDNEVRETYRKILCVGAGTTPGNVLVCMPSYAEASWATEVLKENSSISKPVITDTSSGSGETESLKQAFFQGEPKILTTSLRGTLTEGVDFDGDKLEGVIVCGVPITNTSTDLSSAIKSAYDSRFNDRGFEYGFAVPAVRKSRQAVGRVIRGTEDVGVRILADERYTTTEEFGSVKEYFPENAQDEFLSVSPDNLENQLNEFWRSKDR